MTLTQLAEKHNLDPVAFRLALQEWIDGQEPIAWKYESATEISEGSGRNKYGGFESRLSYNKPKDHPQFRNPEPLIARPTLD